MNDPRIIDLEPESPPRTAALILELFAVLGAGFVLVNAVFTDDEDPYYNLGSWEDNEEPRKDTAFYMIPSLVRDEAARKDEQRQLEPIEERATPKKKTPTTSPTYFQPSKPKPPEVRKPVEAGELVLPGARRDAEPPGVVVPGAAKPVDR